MGSNGKRIIASLLGIHVSEDPPQLQSLVPARVVQKIEAGTLPRFNPSTIMLENGETCHFMDRAALAVQKTEKVYKGKRSGGSYRLTKGFTIHSGNSTTRPIEQNWYEFKEGVVFVTDRRIIFVAQDHGFEKNLRDLTAIIPYTDAITLQYNSQTMTLMLPQPQLMAKVIRMVR